MPDMQTALTKALSQVKFDDEPEGTVEQPKEQSEDKNLSMQLWTYIAANPGANSRQASEATNIPANRASSLLSQMYKHGVMSRKKSISDSYYRYTTTTTERKPLSPQEALAKANAARIAKRANNVKKVKAKPIKWVEDKPTNRSLAEIKRDVIGAKSFNVDELIASLTVVQAKELLVKLREVFNA